HRRPCPWITRDHLGAELADAGLCVVGHRIGKRRVRAEPRVEGDGRQAVRPSVAVTRFIVTVTQRSHPPITGSRLATDAITSAIKLPSQTAGTACKFTNDGSR